MTAAARPSSLWIKKQWFVKMDELIKPAVKAVQDKEIRLIPERMEKTYFNWTDNIKDWCISRQLWWGTQNSGLLLRFLRRNRGSAHRADCLPGSGRHTFYICIPIRWIPGFHPRCGPFSTLGWPEKTKELEYFYPTDVLVTGYDIIFFWVIRMIFSGYEQMGENRSKQYCSTDL